MNSLIKSSMLALMLALAGVANANIVVGQSAPLSGNNAALGQDIRRGALAWFNTVNAKGGVNGNKIELITLDDKNQAALSGQNAKTLLEDHRVIALFGFASATLAAPALPLLEQSGTVLFAPFTGADSIHKQDQRVFTVRASYRDETERILTLWNGIYNKFAVVHYDDAVGNQNYEAVVSILKSAGLSPLSVPVKRNEPVGHDVVPTILAANPQLILFTTNADPIVAIVRKIKAANGFFTMASLSFAGSNFLKDALGSDGAGMAVSTVVPPYRSVALPIVHEYQAAMKRDGNDNLSYTSLEAYIAARALTEGLKRAGAHPTRKTLMNGLENTGRMDLGGYVVNFMSGSHHGSRYVDVALIGSNGKFK